MKWPWTRKPRKEVEALIENIREHPGDWKIFGTSGISWKNECNGMLIWTSYAIGRIKEPEEFELTYLEIRQIRRLLRMDEHEPPLPAKGNKILLALKPLGLKRMLDMGVDENRACEVYRDMK